jgi:hypothetical protein
VSGNRTLIYKPELGKEILAEQGDDEGGEAAN